MRGDRVGTTALQDLTTLGVSVWLDDLSRARLDSGNLAALIGDRSVRGVTSNPAIFEAAISKGAAAYAADLQSLAADGHDVDAIIQTLTSDDVRRACDLFLPIWQESNGVDGRVSLEVDPRLAHDTDGTIAQAKELWALVDRPNLMIKVPATKAGLPAITAVIGAGISVNVTLIFSVERYREVWAAYEAGLARAAAAGIELGSIHSVASFFVSRVDTAVDPQLDALGSAVAQSHRGKAAIANAVLAWDAFLAVTDSPSWKALAERGANAQRPLWASTGVKDLAYDDTRYVVDLAVAGCVNTMPEATMEAVFDHGSCKGDTITPSIAAAAATWQALEALGIDRIAVCDKLEADGVTSFISAWERLRDTVRSAMA
jgi:transaldolase